MVSPTPSCYPELFLFSLNSFNSQCLHEKFFYFCFFLFFFWLILSLTIWADLVDLFISQSPRKICVSHFLGEATSLGEGKLWIQTCWTSLKNWPCVTSCPSGGVGKYDLISLNWFWFVHIPFVSMVKFYSPAQNQVNHLCPPVFSSFLRLTYQIIITIIIVYSFTVFRISVSRWSFHRVWETVNLFKSPGLYSVFWPFSTMLLFGWTPLVLQLPSPSIPFNNPLVTVPNVPMPIGIIVTFMFHSFF